MSEKSVTVVGVVGGLYLAVCILMLAGGNGVPFSGATQDFGSKARVVTDTFVETQLNK